ncbi:MAG: hypothetical protein AA908_08000 [Chlorobi bacterium NICIL-2]|nr:MAG: hypothetical protein AA908_08000 [Chlorobi bacterium NICIL-2]
MVVIIEPIQVMASSGEANLLPTAEQIEAALEGVLDPELGVNIVALGLIYGIEVSPEGIVQLRMTMTTPACPLRTYLARQIAMQLSRIGGITGLRIEWTWDPPWTPEKMRPTARQQLGFPA